MQEIKDLIKETNRILNKNTIYTGAGFFVGAAAFIIALIALIK